MKLKSYAFLLSAFTILNASAQSLVTVDPSIQKFLDNESDFKREKYLNIHAFFQKYDSDFEKFKRDYHLDSNYMGSRLFYYPVSKTKKGNIPVVKNKYDDKRDVVDYIATAAPGALFYDKTIDYGKVDFMPHIKKVANYVAQSYRDEWELVPKYLEPLNEPMIHASDFTKGLEGSDKRVAIESYITYICKYHKEIAQAIRRIPELSNMKIMGFAGAFPEFETNDFQLWKYRFKQFIDVAGNDMDIFSIHLYDGSGVNNAGGRRSGSNVEAILDMIQTYSYIKLGKILPIAVTEYGRLVPNQPEWAKATGAVDNNLKKEVKTVFSNYHPVTNAQAVRSQLHMVMSFMNRQNEIAYSIPFTIGKAPQWALYSKSSLWVKQQDGSFEYSNRKYFFEMLKDIKGKQVLVNSSNIDVQALGYADGKKLYLMLNNMNDESQKVCLDMKMSDGLKKVSVKTLKIFDDRIPELNVTESKTGPSEIELEYGETAVITYEYKKNIKFEQTLRRNKYYSKDYLQKVEGNKEITFNIENVQSTDLSNVVLRLGVGRSHKLAVLPAVVKVNGNIVNIDSDVIKGYDQHTRKQFFGCLEIPVAAKFIKEGNNVVSVKYTEDGGFVTTAILQVEK